MLKKLFAAALCGIVIAFMAQPSDAARTGGQKAGQDAQQEDAHHSHTTALDQRGATLQELDAYFTRFDQPRRGQ